MNFKAIFFTSVFFISATAVFAAGKNHEVALGKVLQKVRPAVTAAGTIDYKAACASCSQVAEKDNKTAAIYSKDNDKTIELTVISEDTLLDVWDALELRDDIPFDYTLDGCYARAHKVAKVLANDDIIAGKFFLEGEIYNPTKFGEAGWKYQVVPIVMVKKGNDIVPYALDPSFFSKPVPLSEWRTKFASYPKSKVKHEFFTNRFTYTAKDKMTTPTEYSDDSLRDMNVTNDEQILMMKAYNKKHPK